MLIKDFLKYKIGKITHLQEEQHYLLSFKIMESKHLIMDIKSPFFWKKIKYLIKEFDEDLHDKIFEYNTLEHSRNDTLGNLQFQHNPIDHLNLDKESNKENPPADNSEIWDLYTIETELIRNSQNKWKLKKYLDEGVILTLTRSGDISEEILKSKKLKYKIFFHKYIKFCSLVIVVCLFFVFFGIVCALLVADLFNLKWSFLQAFWSSLSMPSFLITFLLFLIPFFILILNGLLDTKLGYFTKLIPDQRTDTASLTYLAVNINRIMPPFCLYVLRMFNVDSPQFDKIMYQGEVLPIIINDFNRYLSVLLVLFILLKLGNCYKRLRRCAGFQRFRIGDNKSRKEHIIEGGNSIQKEINKLQNQI